MLPTGIFVKARLDDLVLILPDRLIHNGPSHLTVELRPEGPAPDDQSVLEVYQWSDEWCLIEISGTEKINTLVIESLLGREPLKEVLSCHYRTDRSEYSYAFLREGVLLETFESRGPSIETVNFTSELRKVQLQSLLRASEFMTSSMSQFGIDSGSKTMPGTRKVVFHVHIPDKKTFWQVLLGAVSSK